MDQQQPYVRACVCRFYFILCRFNVVLHVCIQTISLFFPRGLSQNRHFRNTAQKKHYCSVVILYILVAITFTCNPMEIFSPLIGDMIMVLGRVLSVKYLVSTHKVADWYTGDLILKCLLCNIPRKTKYMVWIHIQDSTVPVISGHKWLMMNHVVCAHLWIAWF